MHLISYDKENDSFSFIHNGQQTNIDNKKNTIINASEHLNSKKMVDNLRLGKYSANAEPSMSGQITDVNAWCRSFTTNEMIKWSNCDSFLPDPDLG